MKKLGFLLLLFTSQMAFGGKPALMVAGDSWASFACFSKSFQRVFKEEGLDVQVKGCYKTTRVNWKSSDWVKPKNLKKMVKLASNPNVQVVYMSLGGNDIFWNWRVGMSKEEETLVFTEVYDNLLEISEALLKVNPNLKVLISGYDYVNFVDYIKVPTYWYLHHRMNSPDPLEMNSLLQRFSGFLAEGFQQHPQIYYIHHLGLMHYYYGQEKYNLLPLTTLPPAEISPPDSPMQFGGVSAYESDRRAFFRFGLLNDPIHLSSQSNYFVFRHAFDHYIQNWFE